jgi:nitroreductase
MFRELVRKNRSIRRFHQDRPISREVLLELVEMARVTASGANKQSLKYLLYCDAEDNENIYPHTSWAGYLPDWPGPDKGERPVAYIVILNDTVIQENVDCDQGIAAQTIALGAADMGIGCCMLSALKRIPLRRDLEIPDQYQIKLVLALGYPKEEVVIEQVGDDGEVKYWRDKDSVHHVPKRSIEEIVLN